MKRIIFWSGFIIVLVLIIWGLVVAQGKTSGGVFSELKVPVSVSDHSQGPVDAPIIIVEYSDFQCPACALYFPLVERLINESSTTVRFIYRQFPLYPQPHIHADLASRASEAAALQGKFFEMYRKIFENQSEWDKSKTTAESGIFFASYAKEIGLNMVQYTIDIDSDAVKTKIKEDQDGGVLSGVKGTPTFFINGKSITNPQGYEEFKKLVDDIALKNTK